MLKRILFIIALTTTVISLKAQHTISGTFSPADDYTWIVAYEIGPGTLDYVADTQIENGKFTLDLPENSRPGTYRLVFAVPQDKFNFDVLYSGKENIELSFNAKKGISFISSQENKMFHAYFREIKAAQQKLIDFYNTQKTDESSYKSLIAELTEVQNTYEERSKEMLSGRFIKANRPYIPLDYETPEIYWRHQKDHYFDHLDSKDPVLRSSNFMTDKISDYVFSLTLPGKQDKLAVKKNIRTVSEKLQGTEAWYRAHVFHTLWGEAIANGFETTADHIYDTYLKTLAKETDNHKIIGEIEVHNRLRIGALAPEIEWKDGTDHKKLSELKGADRYVLIFWSSTCSHCLQELPPLNKKLMGRPDIKVIAVGLEDDEVNWKLESGKLKGFEHVVSLGRWESGYAQLYDVHKTPTYYILDPEKRIIAKPGSDKEVIDFLEK